MLFIGFQNNIWMIALESDSKEPTHYLIHIASLYDDIRIYENDKILKKLIHGRELDTLSATMLDSLRKNIKVQLLSEYIDSDKEFNIPTADKDVAYLNNYSITIANFGDTSITAADSVYNRFNYPEKLFTINLFKFKESSQANKKPIYFYSFINLHCMPDKSCWSDNIGIDSLNIENALFTTLRNIISKRKKVGQVISIKEDIVSVKLSNLNVKEDMILYAATVYDFSSDGFKIGTLDLHNAIKYYENLDAKVNDEIIEGLKAKLSWIQKSSKKPTYALHTRTLTTDPFHYFLRVIKVVDSTAITKIQSKKPYVTIRAGDLVAIY